MSTVIQKVKILLDEHQEPFIPFTTSDSIFINGTDERLTDYLDNYYQAGVGIEIDPDTHTISATVNPTNTVTTNGAQNISGQKTFNSYTPKCPNTPLYDNDITNKKYVDTKTVQYEHLPTASVDNLGKIAQYIGVTDTNYTNGYYYQVISNDANPATYSWTRIDVQPSLTYIGNIKDYNSQANALDLDKLEENKVYLLLNDAGLNDTLYIKVTTTAHGVLYGSLHISYYRQQMPCLYLRRHTGEDDLHRTTYGLLYGTAVSIGNDTRLARYDHLITDYITYLSLSNIGGYQDVVNLNMTQTITGKKTFNTLPESSVIPTTNNQLVNKKYVDDTVLIKAYQLAGLNEYSTSTTYVVNDYVYYNALIYKCNTAITTAEDWDSTHWTQKTYLEYLQDTLTI